jgi:hypothetical protein
MYNLYLLNRPKLFGKFTMADDYKTKYSSIKLVYFFIQSVLNDVIFK